MDCIPSRNPPFIGFISVHNSITSLKIGRESQQSSVLIIDVFTGDLLLDHFLAPVIVEPRLGDDFLAKTCFQQRILCSSYVKVNLQKEVRP